MRKIIVPDFIRERWEDNGIVKYPDPVLFEKCSVAGKGEGLSIAKELKGFASEGLGLSAPQIGIAKRVLIYNQKGAYMVNPVIAWRSDALYAEWEGCLSFPFLYCLVQRSIRLKVLYFHGKSSQVRLFNGLEARVVQHEIEHLNGVTFLDRCAGAKWILDGKEYEVKYDDS